MFEPLIVLIGAWVPFLPGVYTGSIVDGREAAPVSSGLSEHARAKHPGRTNDQDHSPTYNADSTRAII